MIEKSSLPSSTTMENTSTPVTGLVESSNQNQSIRVVRDTADDQYEAPSLLFKERTPSRDETGEGPSAAGLRAKTSQMRSGNEGQFVHGLCGKAFVSRSKVKKHHWGSKLDDLETTTGCWAKHEKPDVSWDAHPSCRARVAPLRASHTLPHGVSKRQPNTSFTKHPRILIGHDVNEFPGFPTLEDLPRKVADAVNPSIPRQWHLRDGVDQDSFDSLLTAVNIAAQVDASESQGRSESELGCQDSQAGIGEYRG